MALPVLGKTALITGGGSGICLEFTRLLLRNSCNVLIADQALTADAEKLVEEHGAKVEGKPRVVYKKTDVTDWSQLRAAFDTAVSEFGSLDIVCPGAGIFEPVRLSFIPHPRFAERSRFVFAAIGEQHSLRYVKSIILIQRSGDSIQPRCRSGLECVRTSNTLSCERAS